MVCNVVPPTRYFFWSRVRVSRTAASLLSSSRFFSSYFRVVIQVSEAVQAYLDYKKPLPPLGPP